MINAQRLLGIGKCAHGSEQQRELSQVIDLVQQVKQLAFEPETTNQAFAAEFNQMNQLENAVDVFSSVFG